MRGRFTGLGILGAIGVSLLGAPMAQADWPGQVSGHIYVGGYVGGEQRRVETSRTIIINGQNSQPTVIYEKTEQRQPSHWGGSASYYSYGNHNTWENHNTWGNHTWGNPGNWPQRRFPPTPPITHQPSVIYPSVGQPIVINNPQNVYIAPRRYSGYNFRTRVCTTSFEGIRTCND